MSDDIERKTPVTLSSIEAELVKEQLTSKVSAASRIYRAVILCKWSSLVLSDYKILLLISFIIQVLAGFLNIYDSVTFFSQIYGVFAILGLLCTCCNCAVILYLILDTSSIYACLTALTLAIFAFLFTLVQYTVYTVTVSTQELLLTDIFFEFLLLFVQLFPISICCKLWYYLMYNYDGSVDGRPSGDSDSLEDTCHRMRGRSRSRSRSRSHSRGSKGSFSESKSPIKLTVENELSIKLLGSDYEDEEIDRDNP